MITDLGKQLRKIRIDKQELLSDMASKLGVSSAYLSAVETGKRNAPNEWVNKIVALYHLSSSESDELSDNFYSSKQTLKIPLQNVSEQKRTTALSFAKALDGLNDDELAKIMAVVNGCAKRRR